MPSLTDFERLAQLARRERAPSVNVAGQVMAAIQRSRYRVSRVDSPALVFAGVALAAAALVAIWAVPAWESVQDPLVALFKPLSLALE
ncbi:MAG TPA: hypothetical protein VHC19_17200 [Pirellulales bacterium]|jgi:hypothetical protein|nr:hypothetical protein [Pirellulales bacterium]